MWSERTPDAGDPGWIRTAARRRNTFADRLGDRVLTELRSIVASAADGAWTGESADAFHAQAQTVPVEIGRLIARLRDEAEALVVYARAIEQLQEDAAKLRQQEAAARSELQTAISAVAAQSVVQSDPDPDALRRSRATVTSQSTRLRQIESQWEDLAATRRAADAACEAGIAPAPVPIIGTLTGSELGQLSDDRVLALLSGLSATQLIQLLRHDPALADRIGALKDPSAVAAWWGSLGDPDDPSVVGAAQLALVGLIPASLGNLEGVAYWARDASNRKELTAKIAQLQKIKTLIENGGKLPGSSRCVDVQQMMLDAGFETRTQFEHYLESLVAIRSTLRSSSDVPYQLVNFVQPADHLNPLAAISVGDMDTASNVTVDVPGMGTTVRDSMRSWTEDAANLFREQTSLENLTPGHGGNVAVVAWIGYDTPHMPPSLQVESLDKAQVGARSLSTFLQGVSASQGWDPGSHLSVVAHSYGTTTASLALTTTPVDHFTMLASAGLSRSIDNADDLLVPSGHVWASQSSLDWVAPLGRLGSHPVNPADPGFGAHVFTSEDAVFHGQAYPGSDGHDASPQVTADLDHSSSDNYGYLDRGTISLRNTAETSLGLGDVATAKNTTDVPLSPAAQEVIREMEQQGNYGLIGLPANYGLPWGPGP